MGMVRWTGEGFKLLGKVLTNETVEEWLKGPGKEFAEKILNEMAAKWLFGNVRANSKAKKTVFSNVNSSNTLRAALINSLNNLTGVIRDIALAIEKMGITALTSSPTGFKKLIVVPRALVLNDFTIRLLADLADAAEMKRFQTLPDFFLRKQASEAERELCDRSLREGEWTLVGKGAMILGADEQFDWRLKSISGHYYYGYIDSLFKSADLTERSTKKKFLSELKPALDKKMVQLGKLTTDEIDNITTHFLKKA